MLLAQQLTWDRCMYLLDGRISLGDRLLYFKLAFLILHGYAIRDEMLSKRKKTMKTIVMKSVARN